MTTYTYSPDGTNIEAYRQRKPQSVMTPENGLVVGMPDEDLPLYGWYPERNGTPPNPARLKGYGEPPVIVGQESVYPALERDDAEQETYLRQTKVVALEAIVGDREALWAHEQLLALRSVPPGDLAGVEAIETEVPSPVLLPDDMEAHWQAERYAALLAAEREADNVGSPTMSAAERAEIEVAYKKALDAERGVGTAGAIPPAARPGIPLDGEDTGFIEIAWDDGVDAWGYRNWTATLHREDNTAISLKVYANDGSYFYTPGTFVETGTPDVWEAKSTPAKHPVGDNVGFEVIAGSAAITPLKWLDDGAGAIRFKIRWSRDYVDIRASRK